MHTANVIFDFDLTLFPEESTLGLAKISIKNHHNYASLIDFLENTTIRKKSSGLAYLKNILTILFNINKSNITNYIEISENKINPAFNDIFNQLKEKNIGIYIISNGYIELIHRLVKSLDIDEENIAANRFVWWRENVICVAPSALHGVHGKIKIVKQWRASGKLQGPVIMVGDGQADRNVFQHGLADGFIQANYYRAAEAPSLNENFKVAETPEHLKVILCEMIDKITNSDDLPEAI